MQGNVKIRHGDIFGEAAGLAVLPCATDGALKDFARRTREDLNLPGPPSRLELGQLRILDLDAPHLLVRRLAYAAVRDERGSSPEILRHVGVKLGEFLHREPAVGVVASPLLGTGAGGVPLIPAVEALAHGFRDAAPPDATLSLCAPRLNSFRKLEAWYASWLVKTRTPPRVFLSYNKATQALWVKGLHEFLRSQGIDAIVDRWDLKLMMNLKAWMTQEILRADKVVIVSDEAYAAKANKHEGGVGYETSIIEAELERLSHSGKYLAIIRSGSAASGTPAYLQGRFVIHCSSEAQTPSTYQLILRALYDTAETAPPSGEAPIYL